MRTPRRSPRSRSAPVGRIPYSKFSVKSLLSSIPRSRKRRAVLAKRSPKKFLKYTGVTNSTTMDRSGHLSQDNTNECCAGDRTLESKPASDQHEEPTVNECWIQALHSSALQAESAKVRILSEPSGTLKWLEITRPTCSLQPPLGPVDVVRVLVSVTTRVYQLQVLYPIPRVVERFKGNCMYLCNVQLSSLCEFVLIRASMADLCTCVYVC